MRPNVARNPGRAPNLLLKRDHFCFRTVSVAPKQGQEPSQGSMCILEAVQFVQTGPGGWAQTGQLGPLSQLWSWLAHRWACRKPEPAPEALQPHRALCPGWPTAGPAGSRSPNLSAIRTTPLAFPDTLARGPWHSKQPVAQLSESTEKVSDCVLPHSV